MINGTGCCVHGPVSVTFLRALLIFLLCVFLTIFFVYDVCKPRINNDLSDKMLSIED